MTKEQLETGLVNYFKTQGMSVTPTENLLETGSIDSMSFLELVVYLERDLKLKLAPEDMTIDNFKSVSQIASLFAK